MVCILNNFTVKNLIEQALNEDIGTGDLTTNLLIPNEHKTVARLNSRKEGIVAGIDVVKTVFKMLDPQVEFEVYLNDGDTVKARQDVMLIKANTRAVLTGERTALNFIQRMSAIATLTNKYQEAIKPYNAKITDTRKTTPNFRVFEKYSVKVGGGSPHRYGLFDAVMIKDNHIEAVGSLIEAVRLAKAGVSHTTKIEVETENLNQVKEAVEAKADIIMLDNMPIEEMKEAVELIQGRAVTEASGNINLETLNKVASTGVDYISTSAINTFAGIIDMGLDF